MRRIAMVAMATLGLVAIWLTYQQTIAGSVYSDDPRNVRAQPAPGDDRRGIIVTADGVVVVEDTEDGRTYPLDSDYFHLVGYAAPDGSAGIESTRASDLRPLDDGTITSWLITLFGGDLGAPEVRLTVVDALQQAAVRGLRNKTGAVVAIDPRTGAVLAYASSPAADPNDFAAGDVDLGEFLEEAASLDRAAFRLVPSGSTFKTLVTAAALEEGLTDETLFEDLVEYVAPGAGQPIGNANGRSCASGDEITLREALVVSCNTVFAPLAVQLGGSAVVAMAERAGFNSILPFELGAAISSIAPASELDADPAALAQTGLGERDVRVTPLQMAVIAAGIANDGMMMLPYVVDSVVTLDGSTLDSTRPAEYGRIFSKEIADQLTSMMIDVVAEGTGRAAARSDIDVAGKTGTAEGGGGPHAWFIAFAPADDPTIAIAVLVEGGGSGGSAAAPIAAAVFDAWFEISD